MDSRCIAGEDMEEINREALERLGPYLCEKLVAERHLDYLRSRRVLTRDVAEDICCRGGNAKKTGKMLDYLSENPRGLNYLVESICQVRTKDFVIRKITSEVETVKREREAAILCEAATATTSLFRKYREESTFLSFQSDTGNRGSRHTWSTWRSLFPEYRS